MSNHPEQTIIPLELRQSLLAELDTARQTIAELSNEELGAVVGGEMTNSQAAIIGTGIVGGTALGLGATGIYAVKTTKKFIAGKALEVGKKILTKGKL